MHIIGISTHNEPDLSSNGLIAIRTDQYLEGFVYQAHSIVHISKMSETTLLPYMCSHVICQTGIDLMPYHFYAATFKMIILPQQTASLVKCQSR